MAQVDIIAIDFSEKIPFRLKLPMVKAAIEVCSSTNSVSFFLLGWISDLYRNFSGGTLECRLTSGFSMCSVEFILRSRIPILLRMSKQGGK